MCSKDKSSKENKKRIQPKIEGRNKTGETNYVKPKTKSKRDKHKAYHSYK